MRARAVALLVARRLVVALGLLVLVSFLVFGLLYIAPGSAEQVLIGPRPATPELVASLRHQYHLDDSFLAQYWIYLSHAARLDFGTSIRTGQPVTDVMRGAAPVTIFLGIYAFLLTMVSGIAIGLLAAVRRRTAVDRGVVGLSIVGVSAPAFATGILLIYVFGATLAWFPTLGAGSGFGDRLWHLTLPAIALAVSASALIVKLTRAAVIGALEQDYVTFARARGLSGSRVLFAYGLRNALVPILSGGGLILGYVLTGAVIAEVTFSLPGLGNLLVTAVGGKDVPVVQAVALAFAATIILINLAVDLLYIVVNPQIELEQRGG
jgi:peptide/nickel transport system permease protein